MPAHRDRTHEAGKDDLVALRNHVDTLDREMHEALMRRGDLISQIIRAKEANTPGSVFKPAREASMMRAIAARHQGPIPLSAVEHIWREIIATFTQLQASFQVGVVRGDDPRVRDLARFVFGFSTELKTLASAEEALGWVLAHPDNLAMLPLIQDLEADRWWRHLALDGPHVIARVPAFGMPAHLKPIDALVIGAGETDAATLDVEILSLDSISTAAMDRVVAAFPAHCLVRHGNAALFAVNTGDRPGFETEIRQHAPECRIRLAGHTASPLTER